MVQGKTESVLKWRRASEVQGTLHENTARVLLLCGLVEHLGLRRKGIGSLHEVIQLLSALEDRLDCLVQDNLGLIELLLNAHDRVRLTRVLVFLDVDVDLGEGYRGRIRVLRLRHLGREVIQHLGKQGECGADRVLVVCDDDACKLLGAAAVVNMGSVHVLLHALPLGLGRAIDNGLGEEGHELGDGASLVEGEAGEVRGGAEHGR